MPIKLVINGDYGGWGLVSRECNDLIQRLPRLQDDYPRINPELIAYVEAHPDKCGDLKVITLPSDTTDWEVLETDGNESVIYVLDGQIHWAS